jgi:oligopeptidase B
MLGQPQGTHREITAMLWLCLALLIGPSLDPKAAVPPEARRVPKASVIHGETRVDDYFWLREKSNPAVIAYLDAENAYTEAVTRPIAAKAEALYGEMRLRVKETDLDVPYRLGGWLYYTRTEQGKQYPIHARKRPEPGAAEEVLLDLNELAKGEKFLGLGAFVVSDDGNKLAYATDVTGFRVYTLRVKDLRTGETLPDRIEKVRSPVWAADNQSLFYVAEDAAKRPYQLRRHTVGSTGPDPIVYEEKDELYRLSASRSRDKAFLFFESSSSEMTEVLTLPAERPADAPRVLLPREEDHEYAVEHREGLFYIRTNKDAKNFRIVTAPVADPSPRNWKEFLPYRPEVFVADMDVFRDYVVLTEREGGLPHVDVHDLASATSRRVAFPEPAYSVFLDRNPEFDTDRIRLRYQSLVTPGSVYDYDPRSRALDLRKRTEVLGGYDPANYASEWTHATAGDGTRIPISLVYRKGIARDGRAPLLLYGYGSYGSPLAVNFNPNRVSLLDRGVIYAQAHIRGGGDLGEPWHDAGKMMHKKNTFTDFIAAADDLVARKYTSRDRMAIRGGSAGGLLIGAVLNARPDLCRAAALDVPFVDVINTMLDPSLPLTVQEYLEWGNPNVQAEYDYMKGYCPYTNLAKKNYPSILVRTSLNDSQVMYWEPAKYVAKLRTLKTDSNPLLLKVNMAGGHGGSSGRFDAMKEEAFVAAFLLDQLGVGP